MQCFNIRRISETGQKSFGSFQGPEASSCEREKDGVPKKKSSLFNNFLTIVTDVYAINKAFLLGVIYYYFNLMFC
jgi:hypothetical protein